MGNRISKVYTRTGDDGTTGMADGSRVTKASLIMQAIGDTDELNATIGLLRAETLPGDIDQLLSDMQNNLFSIGGELAAPDFRLIGSSHIRQLEQSIDKYNGSLQPLKEFILPVGTRAVAQCHVVRTACRRAERSLVGLTGRDAVRPELLAYINRMSDMLFVLARYIARQSGSVETYWEKN